MSKDKIINCLFLLFGITYLVAFIYNLSPYWFNPNVTTDDAVQQLYPLHIVLDPTLFQNDLITKMMKSYLTPLHWWISVFVTYLTEDPIMTGHWVMLIQILLATVPVVFGLWHAAGTPAACFGLVWILHSRNLIQRLTCGLPRGWGAVVLSCYFFGVLIKKPRIILLTLVLGALLHPPSTMMVAIAYGLGVLYEAIKQKKITVEFKELLIVTPIVILCALNAVTMPSEIGQMASFETAASMPEFTRPGGRFPFVPLVPWNKEVFSFGFQAFVTRFYNPSSFFATIVPIFAVLGLLSLWLVQAKKKLIEKNTYIFSFLISVLIMYPASRLLAFKLYVPDRHLQLPLAYFFIVAFSYGIATLFKDNKKKQLYCFISLAVIICLGSGHGLYGIANFNYPKDLPQRRFFPWVEKNTPKDAIIAGNPTILDPLALFAKRIAYITTETAHPFYDKYYDAIKPRIINTFTAYYAKTPQDFLQINNFGVGYFVFYRKDFYPDVLLKATYFRPYDILVKDLIGASSPEEFIYKMFSKANVDGKEGVVYKDDSVIIIDMLKAKDFFNE